MTVRHRGQLLLCGIGISILFGLPSPLSAQTTPVIANSSEELRSRAIAFEREGRWSDALPIWCKAYGENRQNDEANEHIQNCLRRMFQAQRQIDKSLREKVLSLTHSQALALYGEVLTTLQTAYVDRAKVSPGRLFQQGVEEFLLTLNDPNFRKQQMPGVRDRDVREFQRRLREYVSVRVVDSIPDALALVKQIAATAKRDLQLSQTSVIVLEFIGGACNSLDEYTSYLSPAELALEMRMGADASVTEVRFVKEGIGFFRIGHFRETTPEEVDAAIAMLKMTSGLMGIKALVIDLQGNSGGSFSAAVQVADRFIPAGVIVSTQGQLDEFNKILSAGLKMGAIEIPLVVLVDGGTASAAEVLAGASATTNGLR